MKMKIIAGFFSLFTLLAVTLLSVPKLLWVFLPPAIFLLITTYVNIKRKISYYNDFPNVLRVFFSCFGGFLLSSGHVLEAVLGFLFILLGVFANDEAMRRVYRNKGVIVLSGIDGTGKSTHAKKIAYWLKQRGIRCRILPFHKYVFLDKLSNLRLRVRKKRKRILERKPPPGWIPAKTTKFSFIRPYLALIDNLLLYLLKVVPYVWRGEYVICDRFIWDNYVKHKMLGYNTRFLFKLSTIIKPKAGIIFDLPADVAVKRVAKRSFHYQYTAEQYEIEIKEFRKIGKKLGYKTVNTEQPIERTWEEIKEYLASELKC